MSDLSSKDYIIAQVNSLISDAGIKPEELDVFSGIEMDINVMKSIIIGMFEQIKAIDGEDAAYEWLEANMDIKWRTDLNLLRPNKYDLVKCSITLNLLVPNNFDNDSVISYATDLAEKGDFDIVVMQSGCYKEDVLKDTYDNDPSDFD